MLSAQKSIHSGAEVVSGHKPFKKSRFRPSQRELSVPSPKDGQPIDVIDVVVQSKLSPSHSNKNRSEFAKKKQRNKLSMADLGARPANTNNDPPEKCMKPINRFDPLAPDFDPSSLVFWVKHEMQMLAEQYRLDQEWLAATKQALTYQQLFEATLGVFRKHLRQCCRLQQCRSLGAIGQHSEMQDKSELAFLKQTNDVLRKSQAWAKQKLEEMKKHWKEACDSVLQLQLQLEQKNAEAFNLQRHDSHTKRLIAHLQEEVRKVLQSKDGLRKYQEANQLLSNMLTELEVDNGNLSKKLSDVEEALHKKNEQYEGLKDDYSKLKQLYRLLETRAKLDGERIAGLPNKPLASHSSRRHESRRSQDNIVLPPENIPGQIAQRGTGSDQQPSARSPSQSARQFVKALRQRIHSPPQPSAS